MDVDHIQAVDYVGLRQIADVADRNSLLGRNVEDEETVGVGRGTDVGVLNVTGGADLWDPSVSVTVLVTRCFFEVAELWAAVPEL